MEEFFDGDVLRSAMPRSPMQTISAERVDTFTGVRGGMGLPSEELPSETPPGDDSIEGGMSISEHSTAGKQKLDKSSALESATARVTATRCSTC